MDKRSIEYHYPLLIWIKDPTYTLNLCNDIYFENILPDGLSLDHLELTNNTTETTITIGDNNLWCLWESTHFYVEDPIDRTTHIKDQFLKMSLSDYTCRLTLHL